MRSCIASYVFKFVILILRKEKIHFMENWLIILVIWGEAELFSGIWEQRKNTIREQGKLFSWILGDQCIIFRNQGSTDPPWGPQRCDFTVDGGLDPCVLKTLRRGQCHCVCLLHFSVCLSICLSKYLHVFVCMSVCLSLSLNICGVVPADQGSRARYRAFEGLLLGL